MNDSLKIWNIFQMSHFPPFSQQEPFFFLLLLARNLNRESKKIPKQIRCRLWMVSLFLCQSSIGRPVFCLHLIEFTFYFEKRVVNHSQNIWHVEGLKLSQCKPAVICFSSSKNLLLLDFFNGDFMMLQILYLLFLTHESMGWSSANRKSCPITFHFLAFGARMQ